MRCERRSRSSSDIVEHRLHSGIAGRGAIRDRQISDHTIELPQEASACIDGGQELRALLTAERVHRSFGLLVELLEKSLGDSDVDGG